MGEADSLIGFFSDIHGNLEAARRGVNLLIRKGAQKFVFMGDSVGYGIDAGVVGFLRNFPKPLQCLLGNHDNMLLSGEWSIQRDDIYQFSKISKKLNRSDLAFMSGWSTSIKIDTPHGTALIVHGGPGHPLMQYIYPNDTLPEVPEGINFVFMGHTHRPFIRKTKDKTYVNVGSCGLPRDSGNLGCVCLFDPERGHIEILRYDITDITQSMVKDGAIHPSVIQVFNRRDEDYFGLLQDIEGETLHDK